MARRAAIDRRLGDEPTDGQVVMFRDAWGEATRCFNLDALGLPADVAMMLGHAFRGHHAGSSPDTQRGCYRSLRIFATFAAEDGAVAGAGCHPN